MGKAIKIDMNKAYDRHEWVFLEKFLLASGFNLEWVKLIICCVKLVSYNIKINGEVGPRIIPQRGLRHGDLLLPYLTSLF